MGDVVIGLDVGDARIGAAVGEVGSSIVFGRGVIDAADRSSAVREVQGLAASERAARVVIGLPKRTDGRRSAQADRVRTFGDALSAAGLDVVYEDERFTTQLAAQQVRAAGLPRGKRQQKGRLDEAAARLILESYLGRVARGLQPDGSDPNP